MTHKKYKYYQFHYAEMNGATVQKLGILNICAAKSITKDCLRQHVRQHLNMPAANIVISHITKLEKDDFEEITRLQQYGVINAFA